MTVIKGDWEEAANTLSKCSNSLREDKPPKVLVKYMAKFNYQCPQDWPGYRTLTSK